MRAAEIVWPGGEHSFALRIGELEALQQATNSGPGEVLGRLYGCMPPNNPLLGPWRLSDVLDTVRLGLVGGGMDGIEARKLVRLQVERDGPTSLITTAATVLLKALEMPDDAPEKPEGVETPPPNGTSET